MIRTNRKLRAEVEKLRKDWSTMFMEAVHREREIRSLWRRLEATANEAKRLREERDHYRTLALDTGVCGSAPMEA